MQASDLKNKKVIIAPFSSEAVILYHMLVQQGVCVSFFMDKDTAIHDKSYMDTPIIPYMYLSNGRNDIVVVTAKQGYVNTQTILFEVLNCGYDKRDIISQEEIELKYDDFDIYSMINFSQISSIKDIYFSELIRKKLFKHTSLNSEGGIITDVELHITTKCTLKCKGCAALIDYFINHQQKDMDFKKSVDTFDFVMNIVDFAKEFIIIGGEPFIYNDIDKLLIHIAESKYMRKIGKVIFITNGTVVPKKSTIDIISRYKHIFQILISDYGESSKKRFELVSELSKKHISYKSHGKDEWYFVNQPILPSAEYIPDNVTKKCSVFECGITDAIRIAEGRIYPCHFVLLASRCKAIPNNRTDYLDIYEDNITVEKLIQFRKEAHIGQWYCSNPFTKDKNKMLHIPVAEQIDKPIECKRYE